MPAPRCCWGFWVVWLWPQPGGASESRGTGDKLEKRQASTANTMSSMSALLNRFAAMSALLALPLAASAQSRYWENWNSYSANYDYGRSTTYVNMGSRVVITSSPRVYSFEARISEEGVSPEQEYRLLVNCTNSTTMYLSHDSTKKWIKATGKFARIVADACR